MKTKALFRTIWTIVMLISWGILLAAYHNRDIPNIIILGFIITWCMIGVSSNQEDA